MEELRKTTEMVVTVTSLWIEIDARDLQNMSHEPVNDEVQDTNCL
jgi:hypothetical protein